MPRFRSQTVRTHRFFLFVLLLLAALAASPVAASPTLELSALGVFPLAGATSGVESPASLSPGGPSGRPTPTRVVVLLPLGEHTEALRSLVQSAPPPQSAVLEYTLPGATYRIDYERVRAIEATSTGDHQAVELIVEGGICWTWQPVGPGPSSSWCADFGGGPE